MSESYIREEKGWQAGVNELVTGTIAPEIWFQKTSLQLLVKVSLEVYHSFSHMTKATRRNTMIRRP